MIKLLIVYLLLINAAAFLLMLADKHKARKKRWRIPESTLLFTAVAGGSIGALLGMYLCRHKTRHLKFTLGVPVILAFQLALAFALWRYIL